MTNATRWADLGDDLHAWHAVRPEATLSELEAALDVRLDALRAELLAELVAATPTPTTCPSCGRPLVQRGRHPRTLTTRGGQALTIARPYLSCPACEEGLFPPG